MWYIVFRTEPNERRFICPNTVSADARLRCRPSVGANGTESGRLRTVIMVSVGIVSRRSGMHSAAKPTRTHVSRGFFIDKRVISSIFQNRV